MKSNLYRWIGMWFQSLEYIFDRKNALNCRATAQIEFLEWKFKLKNYFQNYYSGNYFGKGPKGKLKENSFRVTWDENYNYNYIDYIHSIIQPTRNVS